MLANVIKSERAIKMSIHIIEIFVHMREMLFTYKDILHKLERVERKSAEQDQQIMLIFDYLKQLEAIRQQELEQKSRKRIGFRTTGNAEE